MTERIEPEAIDLTSRMGVIEQSTCMDLVRSTPVGRVGFMSDGGPLVLPVNFALDGDPDSDRPETVVFRSLEGQKLAAAAEGQTVCFEVDDWDAETRSGWSVIIRGTAREVTDWAEREQLENIGLVPWAKEEWRRLWIRIEPTEMTGRVLR